MGLPDAEPRWSLPLRIAFRFVFVYAILYLPSMVFNAMPGIGPETDYYVHFWDPVVLWVGQHIFGVEITIRPAGSGDTTWNYVQVFIFAVLSAGITVIWSVLDRRRPNYRRLHAWLRVAIRFALAVTMFAYGAAKVIQSQFPPPSLSRLSRTYGDSSPMGVLWDFMGLSPGYNFFTGAGELLGGLFLMTRPTALLGALVTFGVMAHVAVLNLCYDVPVKLLSLHCVALALVLIVPDAKRLLSFFVLDQTAPPTAIVHLFRWRWANIAGGILCPLLLSGFLFWSLKDVHDAEVKSAATGRSPFYGIWNVEEFSIDSNDRPSAEKATWRRVFFERPEFIVVQFGDDKRAFYRIQLNESANSFELSTGRPNGDQRFPFTYERPEPDMLKIDGSLSGQSIHTTLRRSKSDFFLTGRGFHWINEFPLNR
jgi:hypothetical protein